MIDFHSHILPGIDDGSRCIDETLWMLRKSYEQGVRVMIATPHFYPWKEYPSSFIERRNASLEKVRTEVAGLKGIPYIITGAEVHYYDGMSKSDEMRNLAIEGTRYILVEMPMCRWTPRMLEDLQGLTVKHKLIPIMAHIERYVKLQWGTSNIKSIKDMGFPIQSNANYFINKDTSKAAIKLLKKGNINILGSDCHNKTSRPPNLRQAYSVINEKLGRSYIDRIESYSKSILL